MTEPNERIGRSRKYKERPNGDLEGQRQPLTLSLPVDLIKQIVQASRKHNISVHEWVENILKGELE